MHISQAGIKFFFINVLKRNWHVFTYLNAKRPKTLPAILSRATETFIIEILKTVYKNGAGYLRLNLKNHMYILSINYLL